MRPASALLGLGVAGLLAVIYWQRSREPIPVTSENPQRENLELQATSPLDSLVASGESLYWEGEFESARAIWTDALTRTRRVGNAKAEARILTWLGLAAYRTGDFREARRLGEEALTLKLRLGPGSELWKSYNALGLLDWNEGRLTEAARLFDEAAAAAGREADEDGAARAANNMGLVYTDLGEFSRARASFEASLAAGRKLGDGQIEGRTLSNLGMLEIQMGDPVGGGAWLGQARHRYHAVGDVTGEVHTLGQLATAYVARGELRRAFAVLDTTIVLARRHDLRPEEASALGLLGDLYRESGDHRRALDLYDQSRRMNHELGLQIEEGWDFLHEADVYARLGDLGRARSLAGQAAAVHRSANAAFDVLTDLLLLAELDQLADETAQARQHLEEAHGLSRSLDSRSAQIEIALAEARIAEHARDSPRVLRVLSTAMAELAGGSYHRLWEAEALRARAYADLGDLEAASAAGYRAVAAVERVRERLGSGFLRTTFLADRRTAYTDLIDVLLRQGRVEEAFEIADAAHGRALLEHLLALPEVRAKDDSATRSLVEGERLLREIDGLIARRDEIEALPPEERDPLAEERAADLTRRIERIRNRYEENLVRVSEREAAVAAILGGRRVRSEEVRRRLQPNEVLLEYVVTPEWVVVFAVTHDRVESFATAEPTEDLIRRIRLARELAGRPAPTPSPARVLESLHRTLIGPLIGTAALADARRLIIVPDAALAHLPFAALRDASRGRFLIESYAVSYLPTAAALPLLRGDHPNPSATRRSSRTTVLAPLPEDLPATHREAQEIERTVRGTRVLEGSRATEESLRRELSSSRVVHVASHGVLEGSNPFFSRIELSRGRGGSTDDGRLEIHEIVGLVVRSPLVFLSGCETEMGFARSSTFAVGDDYATLARAFLYAGARRVIATLWRIDDEGAALFAGRFYHHLRESTADEALAKAQRDMIGSARYAAPYYWASYRLSGEGTLRLR